MFQPSDAPDIISMYQESFGGYPWFEKLSQGAVQDRWNTHAAQPGFDCLIAEIDAFAVGAVWWNTITLDALSQERGSALGDFVAKNCPARLLIWEREVLVRPAYQIRGIATALRSEFLARLTRLPTDFIVLTRMRDDNFGIIRIAEKLGFQRTGLRQPSSADPAIYHEYWYYHP
jgi:GNAT superfamily N-acetyltransferase